MRRNKKFYENKRMRRLYDKYCELGEYGKYKKIRKRDREWGRWNGYEFFLSVTREARKYPFWKDLRAAIKICGKTVLQAPTHGWPSNHFTEDTCKVFEGNVYTLLREYDTKPIFLDRIPIQLRYLFEGERNWCWDPSSEDYHNYKWENFHLAERYIKYLEVHRRRGWEPSYHSEEDSEFVRLRNKLERDNLWPKINRALGVRNKHTWDHVENEINDHKEKTRALKEMNEELAEWQAPQVTRRRHGQDQIHRDWQRLFDEVLSDQYFNRSREEASLTGCRGIFTLDPGRTWYDVQGRRRRVHQPPACRPRGWN